MTPSLARLIAVGAIAGATAAPLAAQATANGASPTDSTVEQIKTMVSRLNLEGHPDEPEWLSHVNASVLKIKLAMAIIGISSIHLLRTFIYAGQLGQSGSSLTETGVMWQAIIHALFVFSAVGIAYVEKLSQPTYARNGH